MNEGYPAYVILICNRCRNAASGALAAQKLISRLEAYPPGDGLVIETIGCTMACDRPLAVGFRVPTEAACPSDGIDPTDDAQAMREFGAHHEALSKAICNVITLPKTRRPSEMEISL